MAGFLYFSNRFRSFRVRFGNPDDDVTADELPLYKGLITDVGQCTVRFVIRPRTGITLTGINFAFSDKKVIYGIGRRHYTSEVQVTKVWFYSSNSKTFFKWGTRIDDRATYTDDLHRLPYRGEALLILNWL